MYLPNVWRYIPYSYEVDRELWAFLWVLNQHKKGSSKDKHSIHKSYNKTGLGYYKSMHKWIVLTFISSLTMMRFEPMISQGDCFCRLSCNVAWTHSSIFLLFVPFISHRAPPPYSWYHPLRKKNTIHKVITMLATSKNVLFPGHNHLLITGADDKTLWLLPEHQRCDVYWNIPA